MMTITRLAAAAALAAASAGSFAANIGPFDLSSGSAGFSATPIAGSFTDTGSFTLSGAPSFIFNGSITAVVQGGQDVDFTSITVTNSSGATVVTFSLLNADPVEVWGSPSGGVSLAAGTYTLNLVGVNSAAIGSYGGNIAVTAVPEPGTYGLMAAGIAALGFIARRRRD